MSKEPTTQQSNFQPAIEAVFQFTMPLLSISKGAATFLVANEWSTYNLSPGNPIWKDWKSSGLAKRVVHAIELFNGGTDHICVYVSADFKQVSLVH